MGLIKPHMENRALIKNLQFTSDACWPNINHNKKRTLLNLLQNFDTGVACVEE
jgi:hypothetical protein